MSLHSCMFEEKKQTVSIRSSIISILHCNFLRLQNLNMFPIRRLDRAKLEHCAFNFIIAMKLHSHTHKHNRKANRSIGLSPIREWMNILLMIKCVQLNEWIFPSSLKWHQFNPCYWMISRGQLIACEVMCLCVWVCIVEIQKLLTK